MYVTNPPPEATFCEWADFYECIQDQVQPKIIAHNECVEKGLECLERFEQQYGDDEDYQQTVERVESFEIQLLAFFDLDLGGSFPAKFCGRVPQTGATPPSLEAERQ